MKGWKPFRTRMRIVYLLLFKWTGCGGHSKDDVSFICRDGNKSISITIREKVDETRN